MYHNQITVAGKWVDCRKAVPRQPIQQVTEELEPNDTVEDGKRVEESQADISKMRVDSQLDSTQLQTLENGLGEKYSSDYSHIKTTVTEAKSLSPDWESVFKERKPSNGHSNRKNIVEENKENRLSDCIDCEQSGPICYESWYEPRKIKLDPRRWLANKPQALGTLATSESVNGLRAKEKITARLY